MREKGYDSDLTDAEWALLEPLMPATYAKGRHHELFEEVGLSSKVNVLPRR